MNLKTSTFVIKSLQSSGVRKRQPLPAIPKRHLKYSAKKQSQTPYLGASHQENSNWLKDPAVDPRDIKIKLSSSQLDNLFTNDFSEHQKNVLRKWLVKLYENVCSDGFIRYINQEFTQGQFKAYISKNIIYHINLLFDKIEVKIDEPIRQQIMNFLNQESEHIFNYVIVKYPQQSTQSTYRRLKKSMPKVDIRAKDTYDMLRYMPEKLNFTWNFDKDYTQQIMKMINYLIELPSSSAKDKSQDFTVFQAFETLMQTMVFTKTNVNVEQMMNQYLKQFRDFELSQFKKFFDPYLEKKATSEISLLLNQKVHPSTKSFSEKQIKNNQFRVLDAPVLRLLTKWSDQLEQKLKHARKLYFDKSLKFKLQNGNDEFLTDEAIRAVIQKSQKFWSQISRYFAQIKYNLINMEQQLFTHQFQGKYVNNIETNIAVFAARTQSCLGQYLLHYINKLIHALATIPKELSEMNDIRAQYYDKRQLEENKKKGQDQQNSQQKQAKQTIIPQRLKFDFVTFKIGDLMRARVKASQQTIISILNTMEIYSEKVPHIFKIVRVKDRLEKKDNDILVNFFFMNKVMCQVQFSVTKISNKKAQRYNTFNHFIYQLTRTKFGPIAECACIIIQYDPFGKHVSQSKNILQEITKFNNVKKIEEQAIKEIMGNKKQLLKKQSQVYKQKGLHVFPYFCSSKCGMLIKNTNPGLFTQKLITSKFKQCNSCHIDRIYQQKGEQMLLQYIFQNKFRSQQINAIENHFAFCNDLQDFQTFLSKVDFIKEITSSGRGFAFQKSLKSLKPIYFKIVKQQQSSNFLMTSFENQKIKILFEIPSTASINQQAHNQMIKKLFQVYFIVLFSQKGHQAQIINTQIQSQKGSQQIRYQQTLCCQLCNTKNLQLATYNGNYSQQIVKSQNLKDLNRMISQRKEQYVGTFKNISNQFEMISSYKPLKVLKIGSNSILNANFISKFPSLLFLDLSENKIKQLPDFTNNRRIKELRIRGNKIISLQPLSILNQLQFLDISANCFENFQGLQGCEKLKQIVAVELEYLNTYNDLQKVKSLQILQLSIVGGIQLAVKDINSFGNLQKIINLEIDGICQIKSIKGLQNFKSLQKFGLKNASINSIKETQLINQNLPEDVQNVNENGAHDENLQFSQRLKDITFQQCKLDNLNGFQNFKYVQKLNISFNQISSFEGLSQIDSLTQLDARSNAIQSLQKLQCTKISLLILQSNQLRSLIGIQKLKSLVTLNVSFNNLSSLAGLTDHPLLQVLDVSGNVITTFEGAQGLTSLKKLNCSENYYISSFQGLQKSVNLESIEATSNGIYTLQHLEKMEKIENLILQNNQLVSLKGIQNKKYLKRLLVKGNRLVSIEEISNCVNLIKLDLIQNQIQSLQPLLMLQNLQWLAFQANAITSLKGCEKLRNLESLFGRSNKIQSIKEIRGMKKVQTINVGSNLINSLQGIQNLPCLIQFAAQDCKLTSCAGMKNLPKLKKLFLRGNQIQSLIQLQSIKDSIDLRLMVIQRNKLKSIKGVQYFPLVQQFAIKNNEVESLEGIQHLKNLRKLYIDDNKIQSLKQCKNLTKIQLIGLMNNRVTQLDSISKSVNCLQLYLHNNPLISIEGLRNYERLNLLVIQKCQLASLKGIENVTSLKRLYVLQTKIQSVAELKNLINLTVLSLSDNKIRSLKGVQNMKNIKSLYFAQNQVQSLQEVQNMTWLEIINLNNNKLRSLNGIQEFSFLDSIFIQNNPLRDIQALKSPKLNQYLKINNIYKDNWISTFVPYQQPKQQNIQSAAALTHDQSTLN